MKHHECPTTKTCKRCEQTKSIGDFGSYFDKRRGKRYQRAKCMICVNLGGKDRYHGDEVKKTAKLTRQKIQRADPEVKARTAAWHRQHNLENAEAISQQKKDYRARPEVKAHEKARSEAYYAARKVEIQAKRKARLEADPKLKAAELERGRNHYASNVPYYTEKSERYRRRTREAIPAWFDAEKALKIYEDARRLSEETGIPHEVDHITPIQGEMVSGLHWHGNLQILTRTENRAKSNKC